MLAKIKDFVNNRDQRSWSKVKMKVRTFIDQYLSDIILLIGVILISLLSFAVGYIVAKQQEVDEINISSPTSASFRSSVKEPIQIEYRYEHQGPISYSIIPGWQPALG